MSKTISDILSNNFGDNQLLESEIHKFLESFLIRVEIGFD
jgi:hypothetical protein